MPETRRAPTAFYAVCLFTAAYLVAAGLAAWTLQNVEFAFYIIVMLVLVGAVAAIHRRVHFSIGLLWCLSLWGAMHMAGGLLPVPEAWPINGENRVVYSWWVVPFTTGEDGRVATGLKYDHLTHAFGFAVTAWACWQGLCSTLRAYRNARDQPAKPAAPPEPISPTWGRLTLCFTAAMGFGALNEIVEFVATTIGPTNVGGYINTSYDLIFNALGALTAVMAIRFVPR